MKRFLIASTALLLSAGAIYAVDLKDFSIYGSVKMGTWLDKTDKFTKDTINFFPLDSITGADPYPDYHFNILPYGRFGIQYNREKLGVTFELGIQTALHNAYLTGITGQQVRRVEKYYATISRFFAEFHLTNTISLIIGQDYVPICFISSNQMFYDNNSFGNTGSLYGGKKPLLALKFSNQNNSSSLCYEAKLAAIKVDTCSVPYLNTEFPLTNTKFPKMEASLSGKFNSELLEQPLTIDCKIAGGFQEYELVRLIADANYNFDSLYHQKVDCYVMGAHGGVKCGPVSLMGDFASGQNWGPYGVYIGNPFMFRGDQLSYLVDIYYPSFSSLPVVGGVWKNNALAKMADIIACVKVLPWLTLEGGYGWVHAENEDKTLSENWHDNSAFYFQSAITLMEMVVFTPEIGAYNYGPDYGYGRIVYAGFGTRIDF